MPIVAAAQRIERELEKFGFPPKFPVEDQFVGYDFMRDEKWQKVLEAFKVERGALARAAGRPLGHCDVPCGCVFIALLVAVVAPLRLIAARC